MPVIALSGAMKISKAKHRFDTLQGWEQGGAASEWCGNSWSCCQSCVSIICLFGLQVPSKKNIKNLLLLNITNKTHFCQVLHFFKFGCFIDFCVLIHFVPGSRGSHPFWRRRCLSHRYPADSGTSSLSASVNMIRPFSLCHSWTSMVFVTSLSVMQDKMVIRTICIF